MILCNYEEKEKNIIMAKIGFDLEKYLRLQSERILERVHTFGGKLYLEFGGKLFDDYHASRVLPGFLPDSKMKVLLQLKDQAEIVIAINAAHIEMNKRRGDLGITYDLDVMRLIDTFRSIGLYVGSVVITQYAGQHAADLFQRKLEALGVVRGSTVQSRNLGHDMMAGFRTLVGGEVTDYADMLTEARQIATGRMVKDAEALGADAIVGMRYASASVMQGAAEVIAYGTAVKFV